MISLEGVVLDLGRFSAARSLAWDLLVTAGYYILADLPPRMRIHWKNYSIHLSLQSHQIMPQTSGFRQKSIVIHPSIFPPAILLDIPLLRLIVPNIRHRRLRPQLHLTDRLAVAEEVEDVVRVDVRELVVFVARAFEVFEVVEETAGPDVDAAVSGASVSRT